MVFVLSTDMRVPRASKAQIWQKVLITRIQSVQQPILLMHCQQRLGPIPKPRNSSRKKVPEVKLPSFSGSIRSSELTAPFRACLTQGGPRRTPAGRLAERPAGKPARCRKPLDIVRIPASRVMKVDTKTSSKRSSYKPTVTVLRLEESTTCATQRSTGMDDLYSGLSASLTPLLDEISPRGVPGPQVFRFPPDSRLHHDPLLPVVTPGYTGQQRLESAKLPTDTHFEPTTPTLPL